MTPLHDSGVGKNMVASMRYWAKATRIIKETGTNSVLPTKLGRMLFEPKGLDPYMEHPATLWLIHWQLASRVEKKQPGFLGPFSHYPAITFDRDNLVKKLDRLATERAWSRASNTTIKNDVACFIRTYVARQPSGKNRTRPTHLKSPPDGGLGLIKAIGKKDGFRFVRGPKTTLGDGVFVYALIDFWSRYSNAATLSFEAVAHAPGSPGPCVPV